ncbi:substrate binding domain-containing protein [Sphingobium yanoikuyae]|uniref:substrate binding domain-containing protein n=1 Tax=Sphingobium yanoikuyae TaxID=13690 RepID=UPI0022855004|nr:substrate binding domain-containing protein [Sphingobium yanoikuyae]
MASRGQKPRGRLRISAPLLFSQTAMGRIAAGFATKFPEIRLEVTTEDRPVDMIEEAYDLVIRVNPATDYTLVGHIFLRDRLVVVAGPTVERTCDMPISAVVRGQVGQAQAWDVATPAGTLRVPVDPILGLSSMVMVRDAVRTGVGVAQLPLSLVSHDLSVGTLMHWGDVDGPETALWALYPSRRLLSARVSAFLGYLKECFPDGTPDELAAYVSA